MNPIEVAFARNNQPGFDCDLSLTMLGGSKVTEEVFRIGDYNRRKTLVRGPCRLPGIAIVSEHQQVRERGTCEMV
jgi:hypothetical protein